MKLEERMNQYYDTFTANDRYICECILRHKKDCKALSIDEFAYRYHVSTSTLSRFAQKLKLPGYSELRAMLRLEENEQKSMVLGQDRTQLLDCYKEVIHYIDTLDCSLIFERMSQAKRIVLLGEGDAQERITKEMKRIFLPTGKRIYDIYGLDMMKSLISFIEPDDIVFIISFHGQSKGLIDFTTHMRTKAIFTISITKLSSNPISQLSSANLYVNSIDLHLAELEYELTTPYFILVELLYIKYKKYCMDMNILP